MDRLHAETAAQSDAVVEVRPGLVVNGPEEFDCHMGDGVHISVLSSVSEILEAKGWEPTSQPPLCSHQFSVLS